MLCAYLAGALLVGLLGNALVGAWWLDPIVGLLITAVAAREGAEAWRAEGCCVSSPLDGRDPAPAIGRNPLLSSGFPRFRGTVRRRKMALGQDGFGKGRVQSGVP